MQNNKIYKKSLKIPMG